MDEQDHLLSRQNTGSVDGQVAVVPQYGGVQDVDNHQAFPESWPPLARLLPVRSSPSRQSAILHSTSAAPASGTDPFHCHPSNGSGDNLAASEHPSKRAVRVLWMSVGVCLFFMLCEVVGGVWAQSLAIITDAAHLLTDLASMLISIFSLYLASRPASQRMSFGWHRAEVVGAFISVFLIWVVTGVLVYLAISRIITQSYDVDGQVMAITAALGVVVNIVMGLLLYCGGHSHSHIGGAHSHSVSIAEDGHVGQNGVEQGEGDSEDTDLLPRKSDTNINIRAAFIHVLGDLLQSIGVLIAAMLILWKESWSVVDPICTLIFSVIVLFTTVYIVRDALVVLLEGRPSTIDFRHVFDALEKIEGVRRVHDLRIWALTMNKVAISVHLEIDPGAQAQTVLKNTTMMLRRNFNVHESTVQIEGYQSQSEDCVQCVAPSR